MNDYYYIWFLFFCVVAYFILTDKSVATFIILLQKIIEVKYQKLKWIIMYSPDNPLVRFIMHRKSLKLAKELEKELFKKDLTKK